MSDYSCKTHGYFNTTVIDGDVPCPWCERDQATDALEQKQQMYDDLMWSYEEVSKKIDRLEAALRKAVTMAKMSDGNWDEGTDGLELQAIESLLAGDSGS